MTRRRPAGAFKVSTRSLRLGRVGPRPSTFVSEYASGDIAILEVVWKGNHTGPLQMPTGAIPASNKRIEIQACQVVKVEGGKVQSFTHYFDMVTLLTQIGAFKG